MKGPSDNGEDWSAQREKIVGLGERSLRKTYYPELQQKLDELERFRALLDQSNDCIFLLHVPSCRFIDVNESACRQLGCAREDVLSRSWDQFFPTDAVNRARELLDSGLQHGRDRDTITTRLLKCSGEDLPVEITIRLVIFNKELYGVAVARDITERQRAQKALLENSRMLRDMELARQIQLSLLPTAPPTVPGASLAGRCVPAAHVGGDYYDYHLRETDTVDMIVADVSGHSIGAALMTAEARAALRAQFVTGGGAGETLAALNRVLHEDLGKAELFITLFCAGYDANSRVLTYANAGHVPPLLFRGSDVPCQWLDAEGMILGIREEVEFEEKRLMMREGDLLVLYTDGVTEARDSTGELFGQARLCAIIGRIHSEAPNAIVDAVLREISTFTGTDVLEDDVTLLVMKVG